MIFGSGGLKWSIPILTFFLTSSFISNINSKGKRDESNNKLIPRNHYQVIANGGIAGFLALVNIFYDDKIIYYFFLASVCAVCSDTWSSEIGTLIKGNTYNILNLKSVEPGFSGGISLSGTLGGIVGSGLIAFSGFYLEDFNINIFVIIIASGILGNLLDSILGSFAQLKYTCPTCHKIIETSIHCGTETKYYKGLRWMDNNVVNFFTSLSGVLFFIILKKIF